MSSKVGIEITTFGLEIHNSIRACERYHGPPREVYHKTRVSEPSLSIQLTVQFVVKAINNSMIPDHQISSLPVFDVLL